MKRFLAMTLCLMMVFLLGCQGGEKPAPTPQENDDLLANVPAEFAVGFGRADIHPTEAVPLDGMGNDLGRMANWKPTTDPNDQIAASMVVISDGDDWQHSVLLCAMDTLYIHKAFRDRAAKAIAEAIGIPAEHVYFSGSHTHSGVTLDHADPSVARYLDMAIPKMADAAVAAVKDLKPAEVQIGSTQVEDLNFIRRFIITGGLHRSVSGDSSFASGDITAYESERDNTIQAIRFVRDEKDIIISNFQVHPTKACSTTEGFASADIVGSVRTIVESDTAVDAHFLFFQGAGADARVGTIWTEDPNYYAATTYGRGAYAKKFAQALLSIQYTTVESGTVKTVRTDKDMGAYLKKPGTAVLELNAVSFGDVAFVTAPYEMFTQSGVQIKEGSPFKLTLICSNANDNFSYIPTEFAFANESFDKNPAGDSFEVRTSKFHGVKDADGNTTYPAETLVAEFLSMLSSIR